MLTNLCEFIFIDPNKEALNLVFDQVREASLYGYRNFIEKKKYLELSLLYCRLYNMLDI